MAFRTLITGGSGFIGSTLVEELLSDGHELRSLDLAPPTLPQHSAIWVKGDVLNPSDLHRLLAEFRPDYCIHLAAETEIGVPAGELSDAYPVNCKSASILAQALAGSTVKKCVIVSTQYVCGPTGKQPAFAEDTFPHTRYGESKVKLEQDTRLHMKTPWVIVRPTYIWGPNNKKNFLQLAQTIAAGRYLHPGPPVVLRAYGYVRTATWTIRMSLTDAVPEGATIYATDRPEDSAQFIRRLGSALGAPPMRSAPRLALKTLAKIGDLIPKFPMNSFRYFNMTTDYPVPYQWTSQYLGDSPVSLEKAATETAAWLHRSKNG